MFKTSRRSSVPCPIPRSGFWTMLALTAHIPAGRAVWHGWRACAQAALHQEIHRHAGWVFCALVERVGRTRRRGPCLIMVEMDVVLRDVSELVWREVELRGDNVGADRVRIGRIAIDRPRPLIVAQGEFPAADMAFGVI